MQFVERTFAVVAALMILSMLLLMNLEVLLRYVFSTSTRISEEYSAYLFCAAPVAGTVTATLRGRVLRITGIVGLLPVRLRAVWEGLIGLVSAGFCAVIAWETLGLVQMSHKLGSRSEQYSETPLMYPQLLLPIGFSLICLAFLVRGGMLCRDLWKNRTDIVDSEDDVLE